MEAADRRWHGHRSNGGQDVDDGRDGLLGGQGRSARYFHDDLIRKQIPSRTDFF